jgi:hypothetical protein
MSEILKDTRIPIGIIALVAILFTFNYIVPGTPLDPYIGQLSNWGIIIAAFAMGFGFINLTRRHGMRVIESGGREYNSLWILIIMYVTAAFGISGGLGDVNYQWIYQNIYMPIGASFLSFAFIYMCSAAVRGMKFRSINETLLLIGCVIALAGNIPLFGTFTGFFIEAAAWANGVPVRGIYAAFFISMALGIVLMGVRTVLGIERGWLGEEEFEEGIP